MLLIIFWLCVSVEAASLNVTFFKQNIKNGSAISITAACDPPFTSNRFEDLVCEYSNPAGGAPTQFTKYNRVLRRIVFPAPRPSDSVRWNIVSAFNSMVFVISPVTFSDEKRQFNCKLEYYDAASSLKSIISEKYTLENVYSEMMLNEADSMQPSTSITQGISASLACTATGRPAPTTKWEINSNINATISNKAVGSPVITFKSVLTIQNPTKAMQNQQITCFFKHPFTSTMNKTTTLNIHYAPEQVSLTASSIIPINGAPVALNCTAMASPAPAFRIIWVNGSSKVTVQDGPSSDYIISNLDYKDYINYTAKYQCIAYNSAGKSPVQGVVLNIQVPPKINIPSAIAAVEGRSFALHCNIIAANPSANVTWHSPTGIQMLSTLGSIFLPSVDRTQQGEYTCLASNGVGPIARKTTYLLVNYGPKISVNRMEHERCIGDIATITCNTLGRPVPIVILYLNGSVLKMNFNTLNYHLLLDSESKFGTYFCVGSNIVGTVNISISFKMKQSGSVKVANVYIKEDSIRVTWQLPECSGNIREIKVQYRKTGQSTWPWELKVPSTSDKEITIKGIEKGVEYEVRVVVIDTNGLAHKLIGTKVANTAMQSSDNGTLIGGSVGGVCLLIAIIGACILISKTRRASFPAENYIAWSSSQGVINSGIDEEMVHSAEIEIENLDDVLYKTQVLSVSGKGKYAESGAFVIPNRRTKQRDSQTAECATINELDTLEEYDETKKSMEQQQSLNKVHFESESNKGITCPLDVACPYNGDVSGSNDMA